MANPNSYGEPGDEHESQRLMEDHEANRYHSVSDMESNQPTDTPYTELNDTQTPVELNRQVQDTVRTEVEQSSIWRIYRTFTIIYNVIETVVLLTVLVMTWGNACGDNSTRIKLYILTIIYLVGNCSLIFARAYNLRERHPRVDSQLIQLTTGIGIVLLFAAIQGKNTGAGCHVTNKPLFVTTLTVAIINIVTAFAPLLFIILLICCLPCITAFLPYLARYLPQDTKAATAEELALLPSFHYEPESYAEAGPGYPRSLYTPAPTPPVPETYQTSEGLTSNNNEEYQCAVCLMEYEPDQELRRFHCKHDFHKECIDNWLLKSAICPVCRVDVFEHFEKDESGQLIPPVINHGGINAHGTPLQDHQIPPSHTAIGTGDNSGQNNTYSAPILNSDDHVGVNIQ